MRGGFLSQRSSYHHADELAFVGFLGGFYPNQFAITEDSDSVSEHEDFFQAMTDVDDGHVLFTEPADYAEEAFGIMLRQHGRWLIQDQNTCLTRQSFRDFNSLTVTYGKHADSGSDIEVGCLQ